MIKANLFKIFWDYEQLKSIQKMKKDNDIIPSVNYNSDDISYMSTSDIPYSEYEYKMT